MQIVSIMSNCTCPGLQSCNQNHQSLNANVFIDFLIDILLLNYVFYFEHYQVIKFFSSNLTGLIFYLHNNQHNLK